MQLTLNPQRLILLLFCAYAFSLPFELALEILLGIDTIFKPFRIICLSIIGLFAIQLLRGKAHISRDIKEDIFFYAVFFYGIVISCFRIITESFHMGLFINDLFQTSLYLATFFIFKSQAYSTKEIVKIIKSFIAGICVNSAYIVYNIFVLGNVGRQAGFMDNPNYLALGLVASLTFLLLSLNLKRNGGRKVLIMASMVLLIYAFGIAGSRTGLILLAIALIFLLYFISFRNKLLIGLFVSLVLLFLIPRNSSSFQYQGLGILIFRVQLLLEAGGEDVRYIVWRGALDALEQKGYWGMGIGQFKSGFAQFFSNESNKLILEIVNRGYYLSTHNDYLAILTDYGLPGLLFFFLFVYYSMKKLWKRLWTTRSFGQQKLWYQYSFILLCMLLLFGLAAENFQQPTYWFFMMLITKTPLSPSLRLQPNTTH